MKRPEIIQAIKTVLHRIAPNATAILYGSEARGDTHRGNYPVLPFIITY